MLTISRLRQRMMPVWLSLAFTLALWLACKWAWDDWFEDPFKYPAKVASLSATVLMCWCLALSARYRVVEGYFGGLDKVYQVHKRLGKWAALTICLHPLFLAAHRLPDVPSFLAFFWFEPALGSLYTWGKNLGIPVLAGLLALTGVSVWRRLPYHVWKRLHEWLGLVFALAVVHILMVNADIAAYWPLAVWMDMLLGFALASFVAIRFLYERTGPRHEYRVEAVETVCDVLELTLAPAGRPMDFKPSQFVYMVVRKPGISPEPHPYSIASGYSLEAWVKLGVKQVGDHTRSLSTLVPGDRVDLYGPYGRFSEAFLSGREDCVFIGGGIGITPFIGMWHVALHAEERLDRERVGAALGFAHPEIVQGWKAPRVALFYLCRQREEASFDDDIRREAARSPIAFRRRCPGETAGPASGAASELDARRSCPQQEDEDLRSGGTTEGATDAPPEGKAHDFPEGQAHDLAVDLDEVPPMPPAIMPADCLEGGGHLYELFVSAERGRFDLEHAAALVGPGFSERIFFLCGPTAMVEGLAASLRRLGVPWRRIVVEDFNLV